MMFLFFKLSISPLLSPYSFSFSFLWPFRSWRMTFFTLFLLISFYFALVQLLTHLMSGFDWTGLDWRIPHWEIVKSAKDAVELVISQHCVCVCARISVKAWVQYVCLDVQNVYVSKVHAYAYSTLFVSPETASHVQTRQIRGDKGWTGVVWSGCPDNQTWQIY